MDSTPPDSVKLKKEKAMLDEIVRGLGEWLLGDTPPESMVIDLVYAFSMDPALLKTFTDLVKSRSVREDLTTF